MPCTRNLAHLTLLTLIAVGGALLSLQLVHAARAAYAPARVQAPQRKPAPVNPGTSKPVAPNAPAATIMVNSLADGAPANNGQCTLREALINANNNDQSGSTDCAAGIGPDTITFSVTGMINLSSALPAIAESLTITGPGANLLTVRRGDAAADFGIFQIPGTGLSVTLSNLTISNGRATTTGLGDFGGGILSLSNLTLTNVAVTGNMAANSGGGVTLAFADGAFTNCTFSGNTAGDSSGGVLYQGDGGHTLLLVNSTVSGNTVNGSGRGGGILHFSQSGNGGTLTVVNSTIANNTSVTANSGGIRTETQNAGSTATTTLRNTIIANNTLPNLQAAATNGGNTPTVTSQGFNLASDNSVALLNQASDQNNTNPLLGPLQNNGGPTPTHALLAGSPALDKGSFVAGVTTDQRGLTRPVDITSIPMASGGNESDIGAFEAQAIIVTNANDTGAGSLRAAITTANTNGAGLDDIIFDNTFFNTQRTITLTSGELDINSSVTITGPGVNLLTLSGNNTNRIFGIPSGMSNITITDLTISNGKTTADGGGIVCSSNLTLARCAILNCASGNGFDGGGIDLLSATGTFTDCTFSGNVAGGGGGAINLSLATGTFTGCTFSGNQANSSGGGIFNTGALTVVNSTFTNNTSGGNQTAGGIRNLSNNPMTLLNTTISGNTATGATGTAGGLWTNGPTTITNCTITNNTSNANNAGGLRRFAGTTTIRNSIIAANQNNTTVPDVVAVGNTGITSNGYNLIGNSGSVTFNATGDQSGTGESPLNPQLGPLQNNGGTTPTHALLAGSPALDKGHSSGSTTDQRGLLRPFDITTIPFATGGDNADIGAFEAQGAPQSFIVTTTADTGAGSLRQAITDAAGAAGDDAITFAASLNNMTITLASEIRIATASGGITINGPGANLLTIDGGPGTNRVFSIEAGTPVTLNDVTLTGGNGTGTTISGFGGAIMVRNANAIFNLNRCRVTGNTAPNSGGGLSSSASAVVNISDSTFDNNTATFSGGGLQNEGGTMTVRNTTFSGNRANSAAFGGGGISQLGIGTLTLTNATLTNNTAATNGGGILRDSGTVTVRNTIIAGNTDASGGNAPDIFGTFVSSGFNLIGDGGGGTGFTQGVNSDQVGTAAAVLNPLLAFLANNGGPTPTHALLAGSPALDKGHSSGSTTDQRGVLRPFDITTIPFATGGDNADIGAFETQALIVTNANDLGAGSLRQALTDANANADLNDILFDATFFNVARIINLASALPNLTTNLTIHGPGANLLTVRRDTGGDYGIFTVNAGQTVSLSNLTISNGKTPSGQSGGGILNTGTLSLANCIVSGNTATAAFGGGIGSSSSLTITNSLISGNNANNGGGVALAGGTLTMSNSTVSGNTAVFQSGGLSIFPGTATLTNCTISGNTSGSWPGAILNATNTGQTSALTLTNCTVTGNVTTTSGIGNIVTANQGGVSPTTQLKNTLVAANTGPNFTTSNGTLTSLGNNLDSDGSSGFTNGVNGNIVGTAGAPLNAWLGLLADNGGPTPTHALLLGSPALDKGSLAAGVITDQRGLMRPFDISSILPASNGNDSDIGAFEAQSLPLPGIIINDVTVAEGNAGTSTATFNVTLSATSAQTVTVQYATANGTATAGSDYVATSGTLTFNPGVTSQPIVVTINGDTVFEPSETFFVNLTNPTNAALNDQQGLGTILNDEAYIVTNANDADAGSLRQALLDANASPGVDTIQFEPVFFGTPRTINLAGALPNISDSLTLNGPGANLLTVRRDTGGNYGIFTINSGQTVTLAGLTITGGNVSDGGGILNNGTLMVTNCQISGNTANFGGGIENGFGGTLTVTGSIIANNSANGSSTGGGH